MQDEFSPISKEIIENRWQGMANDPERVPCTWEHSAEIRRKGKRRTPRGIGTDGNGGAWDFPEGEGGEKKIIG